MSEYEFVQIGAVAIRLDKITCVQFDPSESRVWLHFVGDSGPGFQAHTLTGASADAFRSWWDTRANVYVIEQGDE